MPLHIVRNDITKMKVDAIVNAANSSLLGGGGVDGCIHRAAGPKLLVECMKLRGCETGSAKMTGAYKLPCRYVIHAVGPRWKGGRCGEREKLISCYRTSLELAKEAGCETVAFPLISSGIYGYPKDQALRVAVDTIGAFLMEHEMTVYLVIFDRKAYQISGKLFADIEEYIDDRYVEEYEDEWFEYGRRMEPQPDINYGAPKPQRRAGRPLRSELEQKEGQSFGPELQQSEGQPFWQEPQQNAGRPLRSETLSSRRFDSLDEAVNEIDESFSEMLLRKIDESGMTDAQCYKKANIDRKLFSKIRSDKHYQPSKPTAIAFAIALELSLADTRELLMKAGFALSHSNRFDIIIEFFIERGNYNIFEINEALFAFDQSLLGA